jgi:uncharacterized membrane protein
MWAYWTRDDPRYQSARRFQVITMGPVFTVAVIFFAVERAWFIAAVCAIAAAFCLWRWRALR